MNYKSDPTFFNYVALWRAIVKKESLGDALRMCGVPTTKQDRTHVGMKRKVKSTNVKTGKETIYDSIQVASAAAGLKSTGIWNYIRNGKEYKGCTWQYLEEYNEQNK